MPSPLRLTAAAIFLALGAPFLAQANPSAPTPATRNSELEGLRAENARLRAQLEALQTKVDSLQAKITATAQTQAAKKDPVRAFTTMTDLLEKVPAELRPQGKPEWYKFTEAKFVKWLEQDMVGVTMDVSLQYSRGPTQRNLISVSAGQFVVYASSFDSKHFTYFGAEHQWAVRFPTMYFDEAGARKWDAIKKGTLFSVKGVIKSVSISPAGKESNQGSHLPSYLFMFELRDLEITPP